MQELTAAGWPAWLAQWQWPGDRTEQVAVHTALDRVLARPVCAARAVPPLPAARMSGLAVAAAQTGSDVYLQLGSEAFAVAAGHMLPPGTDTVLGDLDYMRSGSLAWIVERAQPGQGVVPRGADFANGDIVLAAGHRLTGEALVSCLAAGVSRVDVVRRPRVAIFPLGREWAEPAGEIGAGQLPETGSMLLAAAAQAWGAEPQVNPIVSTGEQLTERLKLAARSADVLVVIDSSRACGAALALIGDKPCLHMPGTPAPLWAAALRWLRSLLDDWYGRNPAGQATIDAVLAGPQAAVPGGSLLLVAHVGDRAVAWPLPGVLGGYRSVVEANALLATDDGAEQGEIVPVQLLEPTETMRRRVLLAGPREALAVQPQTVAEEPYVHFLTMPAESAEVSLAAGFVHGAMQGESGAWTLAAGAQPTALHRLLQGALAPGAAAPPGWSVAPAVLAEVAAGLDDAVVDEPGATDDDRDGE